MLQWYINTYTVALLANTQLGCTMAKPVFNAYIVHEYTNKDGKKDSFWTRIRAVFPHGDGKGYDVVLEALPVNGRISLREPKADEAGAPEA